MKSRRVTWLIVLLLVVIVATSLVLVLHKNAPAPAKQNLTQTPTITTNDVSYIAPTNWAQLTKTELSKEGAASGIGRLSAPPAKFTMAIEPTLSSPKTAASLRTQTLLGLQHLTSYTFVSEKTTPVGGETAEQFIYTFGNSDKTEQQLFVILHEGRAFSLLFTANQKDFGSQVTDFQKIIHSFRFQ